MAEEGQMALGDLRVLELANELGLLTGKILADLGADVIKIERPGGDATREMAPFYHDIPHRERSLFFWFYNAHKRAVTLNPETADGRELFKGLVKTADILIETFAPGYMERLGLGYKELSKVNPRLIMTSITPFGQTGPYKDYKASDIVGVAMGGMMATEGYPDGPPIIPYGFQGYHTASNHAAIASLIALYYRDFTGRGQHIDVSMQSALAQSLEFTNIFYLYGVGVLKRRGSRHGSDGMGGTKQHILPCKDGFICDFGAVGPVEWMKADGVAGTLADDPRWIDDPLFKRQPGNEDYMDARQRDFCLLHTKQEINDGCQAQHVSWAKLNTLEDLFTDPHLISRDFFVDVEHPELGATFRYPGAPYKLRETPGRVGRRAPLIGEHNVDIYQKELGLTPEQLTILGNAGVI